MTSLHSLVKVCTLFCTFHVIKCFTAKKESDNPCNELFTLGVDESYTIDVENCNQFQHEGCKIGFQGDGTNVIDMYRVCVDVVDAGDICNGSITFSQSGRGKESKRTRVTYKCADIPSQWCGEIGTIVYIELTSILSGNSSQPSLKLKVTLESSNSFIKSIVVIISLILGAIVITAVVSCTIRCSTRSHKRIFSLSSQCPEDVNYGSNQNIHDKEKEKRSRHSQIFTSYHNRIHAPCILYTNFPAPPPYTALHYSHGRDRLDIDGASSNDGSGRTTPPVRDSTIPPPPYTVR